MAASTPVQRVAGYARRRFDEASLIAAAASIAFKDAADLSEAEWAVAAAMQRAHPQAGATIEELGEWLRGMQDHQIDGVVSNTKGVLHEMEFLRLENADGDTIHAALFDQTNHAANDIRFIDQSTGESWDAQLKATDSPSYVREWVEGHPDGTILVTEEVARELGLPGSGLENGELTARTEDLVNRLIDASDSSTLWSYFPALTVASVGLVVWALWQRYRIGAISAERFRWMVAKASGAKAAKIGALMLALSTPGLNVIAGAGLGGLLAMDLIRARRSRVTTRARTATAVIA